MLKLPEEFVMLGRVFGVLSGLFLHYRPAPSAILLVLPRVIAALSALERQASDTAGKGC